MDQTYGVLSIVLAALVLLGIKWMSSPRTAVRGNRLSAFSMLAAILLVLWNNDIINVPIIWVAMIVGAGLGYRLAVKATMIQMPQMVALLNGLGGGASALVAMAEIMDSYAELAPFNRFTSQLALIVGGVTLSGSLIAAAKLDRRMSQRPIIINGHSAISNASVIAMLVLAIISVNRSAATGISFLILLLSLAYGVLFAIRVGGADMPITISLLNSFSGLAGAIVGFTISEPLLVAVGAIVGASGLILTQIMCRAMNRSLMNVLSGSIAAKKPAAKKPQPAPVQPAAPQPLPEQPEPAKKTGGDLLREAKKVIIVPGYGMAIAQAQGQIKKLVDVLEEQGTEVKFAIHPVAGRMPGHMNVLLAEVDIPYDKLCEMDDINPEFAETDVVLVVGACDVVNPAANTAEDTPIYGMPVLDVDQAKQVLVCNLDTKPGYSGVDNPLYEMPHVQLLLGDAKETLEQLLAEFAGTAPAAKPAATADAPAADSLGATLAAAEKVIIVPGYGMAIAQAQGQVKKLVDALEEQGTEVKFAIHPVAGRMPGHMNVLLAEVDIPYDKLCEMDDINPEFAETDVAIVVGACDVVNPAANTAKDTPIYGMPVLDVDQAKQVLVCNLDTKPGYSGVDNPLYEMPHVQLLLGDAKTSVQQLLDELSGHASQAAASPAPATSAQPTAASALTQAKKVIIVPGYGMAIAQAQGEVKKLVDALEEQGTEVKFAIHPVAGRMPGHMNVLLAEVDVPYDKLCEMDDINPEFPGTDVAIVVGACDVVNPAANTAEDTPIYGMPVLDVDQAKQVLVCNLDTKPGYSGVDNPLYEMPHVQLLLGDAKETLQQLLADLAAAPSATAEAPATAETDLSQILTTAKKVIMVPGYGMAIAQAQSHVKKLLDALEAQGTEVKFAIHPVAGRMPGHMNVLLAEVDVPYDKLCEMDDINPEFAETDVAIVVGACDVVNPAANTAEDTPIYGMPVLDVDQAKQVLVCNLDTKPGYSGVDNPLYEMPHVQLLLGDAKESLEKLLQAVQQ